MLFFLNHLKEGMPKDKAMQLAKEQFLEQSDPAATAPFFWAGFRLNGSNAVLDVEEKTPFGYLGGLLILLLFGGAIMAWIYKSRKSIAAFSF